MKKRQTILAALVAAVVLMATAAAVSADAASGAAWLATQQQADGGFEVAGFAGFETSDAMLAISEAAQPGGSWDAGVARSAVSAVSTGRGLTPYDAIDDEAEVGPTAGAAAKLIAQVGAPAGWSDGLSPVAFDPALDGGAVNLVAAMDAGFDGSTGLYGTFGDTLSAVLAQRQLCRDVPAATVAAVLAAAAPSGGWNFAGDPTDDTFDPDITGRTLQALAAAGVADDDEAVAAALRRLAREHDATSGGWIAFGAANPNSTALGILGLDAYGIDTTTRAWRDGLAPERAAEPYVAPAAYLLAQQQPDGRIASPSDSFGVNTFATSQGVQALALRWNWTTPGPCPDLSAPAPPTSSTTVAPTTTSVPSSTTTAPATTVAPKTAPVTTPPTAPTTVRPPSGRPRVRSASATSTAPTATTLATTGSSSWQTTVFLAGLLVLAGSLLVRARHRPHPVAARDPVSPHRREPGGADRGSGADDGRSRFGGTTPPTRPRSTGPASWWIPVTARDRTRRVSGSRRSRSRAWNSWLGAPSTPGSVRSAASVEPCARSRGRGAAPTRPALSCGGTQYWAYALANPGEGTFSQAPVGAGSRTVTDGAVDGWRWGSGDPPAFRSIERICPAAPPTTPTPPAGSARADHRPRVPAGDGPRPRHRAPRRSLPGRLRRSR